MRKKIYILYLAIATLLIGSLFFSNIATIIGPEGEELTIKYTEKGLYLTLIIAATLGHVLAFFAMSVRMLQVRLCTLVALILVGFQIVLAIAFFQNKDSMVFSVTILFPLVASVLDFLAARGFFIEETKVIVSKKIREAKKSR